MAGRSRNGQDTTHEATKGGARTEFHTVTTEEAVQMFRDAGVPRTRRSINRWCKVSPEEDGRLDAYKDKNDGRYYITPASIELVIEEERAKDERRKDRLESRDNSSGRRQTGAGTGESESASNGVNASDGENDQSLNAKVQRLQMDVKVKDKMLEYQIQERQKDLNRIENANRYLGHLEARVTQLEGPDSNVLRMGRGQDQDPEVGTVGESGSEAA